MTTPSSVSRRDDPQREVNRIAGEFAQHLCDDWLFPQTADEAVAALCDLAGEVR